MGERRGPGSDLHALPSLTPRAHSRWSVWAWVKPSSRRPKMPLYNPVSTLGAGNGGTQLGLRSPETSRQGDGAATGTGSRKLRTLDPTTTSFFHLVVVQLLSCVRLFGTPWTVALQALLSRGFPKQEYWSGLSFPPPGDLPDPGIKPLSATLQADSLPTEPPGLALTYPHS